jgi:acyl carrier protein
MDKQELILSINEALAGEFEVEVTDILPQAIIKDALHLDSLALIDMVALIESTYKVKIKGADINRIKTFENLYDIIYEQINA